MGIYLDSVVVSHVARVDWDLGSTPDELKVSLQFFLRVAGHNLPVHDYHWMVFVDVVGGKLLENFKINELWSTCSDFELLPGQEGEDIKINDEVDSILDPTHLLVSLGQLNFCNEINELFMVSMGNLLVLSIGAKLYEFTISKICNESLIYFGIKVLNVF